MTVSVTEAIKLNLLVPQPPEDSPLPVGTWIAARRVVGDATGGIIDIVFAPNSAALAARYLWSWEGFSMRSEPTPIANLHAQITLVPAEPHTDGGGNINGILFATYLQLIAAVTIAGALYFPTNFQAIMGYIHQPGGGLTNSYTIDIDSNPNLTVFRAAAWGYVWHPQARKRAGGPQRPR